MKKAILFLVLLVPMYFISAQDAHKLVEEGAVLTLGACTVSGYEHIDFPRKNILLKRGSTANFSILAGKKVVVEQISTKSDGSVTAVLKREDGQKFFRFYPSVTTNLERALESGELKLPKKVGKQAIAK